MYFCNDGRDERRSTGQIYHLLIENKALFEFPWTHRLFLQLELATLDPSELLLE
jgi:hypothetical protein